MIQAVNRARAVGSAVHAVVSGRSNGRDEEGRTTLPCRPLRVRATSASGSRRSRRALDHAATCWSGLRFVRDPREPASRSDIAMFTEGWRQDVALPASVAGRPAGREDAAGLDRRGVAPERPRWNVRRARAAAPRMRGRSRPPGRRRRRHSSEDPEELRAIETLPRRVADRVPGSEPAARPPRAAALRRRGAVALPNATIYLEAGAADWEPAPARAVSSAHRRSARSAASC